MTKLGLWTPFIDESEMLGWYSLPTELRNECSTYRPDGHEMTPLSDGAYRALHQRTVGYVRRSVAPFNPAYHTDEMHFAETEQLGLTAADAYANGDRRKLPLLVRQVFGLALRTHDAHHCGSTFRIMARRGVYQPSLGITVTNEWVTARAVAHLMREHGLNLPARLFQTGVIWSSTYGGHTALGKRLGIPLPQPRTIWGAIMRAADICPQPTFAQWLRRSIAANYGEVPAVPPPRTLTEFAQESCKFMRLIEHHFRRMDALAGMPLSTRLGWQNRVVIVQKGLEALLSGDRPLARHVRAEAARYGTELG